MSEIASRIEAVSRPDERRRLEERMRAEEPDPAEIELGPLLAAALAAALVEYRRYVGQRNAQVDTDDDKTNWRIAGRLEQLRGMV